MSFTNGTLIDDSFADEIREVGNFYPAFSIEGYEAVKAEVFAIEEFDQQEMKLRQLLITGSSPLLDISLKDSGIRDRYRCMVVGLEEGKERLSQVPPSRKFRKGDILWIVGEEANLKELTQ